MWVGKSHIYCNWILESQLYYLNKKIRQLEMRNMNKDGRLQNEDVWNSPGELCRTKILLVLNTYVVVGKVKSFADKVYGTNIMCLILYGQPGLWAIFYFFLVGPLG